MMRARIKPHNFFFFFIFFIFPLNKHEYNIFNKISTVKKKCKGHKYSNLIICPLIKSQLFFFSYLEVM